MKVNELKIGNYIKFSDPINGTNIYRVYYIADYGNISSVSLEGKGQLASCTVKDIEPIELTEEVLLKIGFKKVFQSKVTKGRFELNVDMGDNEFRNIVYHIYASGNTNLNITQRRCASLCDDSMNKSGIKYLHQLQNAYFLLTNQEMEIEL